MVRSQLTELQQEIDKPQVQWNERKDNIQIDMGVPIAVQTVNWKIIFPATLDNLTLSILNKIMYVRNVWRRSLPGSPITKIEYVMNEDLYVQFKTAKTELERSSRPSAEKILFHGTAVGNINRYISSKFRPFLRIVFLQRDSKSVVLTVMCRGTEHHMYLSPRNDVL
jgi:hypothetical protein